MTPAPKATGDPHAPGGRECPELIQYWHSGRPPRELDPLMASFARHDPGLRRRLFDESEGRALIAERFSSREVDAFAACAVPAMQADYFRYCAVHALGGIYADADLLCVGSVRPLLSATAGTLLGRAQIPPGWPSDLFGDAPRIGRYRIVANSFLAFPRAGHPLPRLAIEVATAAIERRVAEDVAIVTGPGVLTSLYVLARLGSADAFRDHTAGGILEPTAELVCEVVGEPERAAEALDGVAILPFGGSACPVREAQARLAYKATDDHWVNFRSSIFRRARRPAPGR